MHSTAGLTTEIRRAAVSAFQAPRLVVSGEDLPVEIIVGEMVAVDQDQPTDAHAGQQFGYGTSQATQPENGRARLQQAQLALLPDGTEVA